MDLPWKRAIVVGASSGIGEELARQLAASGCQVALVARREEELNRIAGEINSTSPDNLARSFAHDVRAYDDVPELFQRIAQDMGGLDLVIYCAGVMPLGEPYNSEKDRLTLETNIMGAIGWLNEAAKRFEREKAGTIVGISSVAGERGRRGMPAYCASKAALTCFLEGLRNRVSRHGVVVVTAKPGPVDTPATKGLEKLPLLIPARQAAAEILNAARRGANNAYVPRTWRPIMAILRGLPSGIFRKLNI